MEELVAVLQALASPKNEERKAAEAFFNSKLLASPLETTQGLLNVLSSAETALQMRSFAGVLMRRAIEKSTFGPALDAQLRTALVGIWQRERDPMLLKRLSHAMAQSAMKTDSPWTDLLPQVVGFVMAQQQSGADQEQLQACVVPALLLVEVLTDYCPDMILSNLPSLGPFLGAFLVSENAAIQTACARATAACIVAVEDENARNAFKPAVQPIISVLGNVLGRNDEAEAVAIMEYLVAIAQESAVFFKASLDGVVAAMLTVARAENLDFSTRAMALELMVTLSEMAPALARRCTGLVEGLVPLALHIMLDVEEEEDEWAQGKYMSEPEDENCFVGEEAIERTAAGMGCRVLAPAVLSLAQQFLARKGPGEWRQRRAAISCLCRLAEGSTKPFASHLAAALSCVEAGLVDSSPRVQYQALETVGRFASLFPQQVPDMVARYVPAVTAMMQAQGVCERVRGHATAALISLTDPEHCEGSVLQEHLEPLLRALTVCLQASSLEVQPFCLDLLGRVAQVSDEAFKPYYSAFMPGIKHILRTALSPELSKLRGKAMTCAGTLSDAVGAELFSADALEVMELILGAMQQQGGAADCDVTFDHALPACARIAKALGPRFEQFLPAVMAPLLSGAAQEVHCSIEDASPDDVDDDDEDATEENGLNSMVFDFGAGVKKRITLNTHAIQQKKAAAEMMYEFASSLKGHLGQYLVPCFQVTVPMLTNKHSSDVRSSSSLALAKLFEAFFDALSRGVVAPADVTSALSQALSALLFCLVGETNTTARACAAEALRDVLQACFHSGVEAADGSRGEALLRPDLENCAKIVSEVLARCSESMGRHREFHKAFSSNEGLDTEDRGQFSEELEEEEEHFANLTDALGQLLKLHGDGLMQIFDQSIAPFYAPLLAADQPAQLQVVAVCMIDDVVEFGGAGAAKYLSSALPLYLRNLQATHPVLRQCSAYGLAQAARTAPAAFGPFVQQAVPALVALVNAPDAREEDNEGTTENALYALGIVATHPHYRTLGLGDQAVAETAGVWLRGLPLRADETEAKYAHAQLCDCVERGDAAVMGGGAYSHLGEVLRVMAEVLSSAARAGGEGEGETLAHPDTVARMRGILRAMGSGAMGVPGPTMQAAFAQVSAPNQAVLQSVMA